MNEEEHDTRDSRSKSYGVLRASISAGYEGGVTAGSLGWLSTFSIKLMKFKPHGRMVR